MMKPTITESFVDAARALKYESLPSEAVEMAKHVTLDGLAVMLAGAEEPSGVGRISIQYVKEMGGAPHATVITGGFKTSVINAAYANGTMAHALDFDNTWHPLNHPTSPTLPAILAIAEHRALPGARVIEAIAVAFEVQARVRMAATGMETGSGFHKPGMTGTMGAVAAAGRLLDLTRDQMLMAFGTAGSRAGSMSINTGTMTKSSHAGHAARMGVECATLAKMGWTASPRLFEAKGFFDTFFGGNAKPELLVKDFANPLRMVSPGVGFKKYPSNYFTHRGIDAALAIRAERGFDASRIQAVEVFFPKVEYVNRPVPQTGLDGKFSVQYATAVALLDGDVTVESFSDERRFAADIEALLPRVKLTVDESISPEFDRMHVVVTVTMGNGERYSKKVDKLSGAMGYPLTREQRMKKFHSCARFGLDQRAADRVVDLVENLDELGDVSELMALMLSKSA